MRTLALLVIIALCLLGVYAECDNCKDSSSPYCCSKWGWCGSGASFCDPGQGCQKNCWGTKTTSKEAPTTGVTPTTSSTAAPPTTSQRPTAPAPTGSGHKYQLAAYWGQDTIGIHDANNLQKNLDYYCDDANDILVVSFLIAFFGTDKVGNTSLPIINLANSCDKSFDAYPTVLNCPHVGEAIKTCQAKGKKIILSLGGAAGSYGFSNAAQPAQFAQTLWDMFLGGSNPNNLPRPFGDAVFDGVDFDIEGGSPQYYDTFVKILKEKYFNNSTRKYYITGAPQCPFPDAYVGAALDTGYFDYAFVQFYNNYCGVTQWENPNSFNWKVWEDFASKHPNTKIFLGVPADTYAANAGSYVPPTIVGQIVGTIKNSPAFGGIMIWDATVSKVNGFGAAVAAFIH